VDGNRLLSTMAHVLACAAERPDRTWKDASSTGQRRVMLGPALAARTLRD